MDNLHDYFLAGYEAAKKSERWLDCELTGPQRDKWMKGFRLYLDERK